MTLREKIDGLKRFGRDFAGAPMVDMPKGKWLRYDDVLRIVAEHEQKTADLIASIWGLICECTNNDMIAKQNAVPNLQLLHECRELRKKIAEPEQQTAPPVGQAGGEPYRPMSSVSTGLRAVHAVWEDMAGDVVRVFGTADRDTRMVRPRGATWAEVEQMARQEEPAEVPRWRKELERLHATIGQEPDPLSMADHRRLAALLDLAILADVIAFGQGQAVVPGGVAKLLGMNLPAQWMARRDHGEVICTHSTWAPYIWGPAAFMRIVDEYGDSLCGAP